MVFKSYLLTFSNSLRNAGIPIFLSNIIELIKILPSINITDLSLFRTTTKAILLNNKTDEPLFDYIFNKFFLKFSKEEEDEFIKEKQIEELKSEDIEEIDIEEFEQYLEMDEDIYNKKQKLNEMELTKEKEIELETEEEQQKEIEESLEDFESELEFEEIEKKEELGTQEITQNIPEEEGEETKHGGEEFHKEIENSIMNNPNSSSNLEKSLEKLKSNLKSKNRLDTSEMNNYLSNMNLLNEKIGELEQELDNRLNEKEMNNLEEKEMKLYKNIKSLNKGITHLNNTLKEMRIKQIQEQLNDEIKKAINKDRRIHPLVYPSFELFKSELINKTFKENPHFNIENILEIIDEIQDPIMKNKDFRELVDLNLEKYNKAIREAKEKWLQDLLERRKGIETEMNQLFSRDISELTEEEIDDMKRRISLFLKQIHIKKKNIYRIASRGKVIDIKNTIRNFSRKKIEFIYKKSKKKSLERLIFLIDISGSIINYIPFFLIIMREFKDIIHKIKYYFFIDYSIDVTEYIEEMDGDDLLYLRNNDLWKEFRKFNNNYSDIGQGIDTFHSLYTNELRKDDFVLIFSDGRNNYKDTTGEYALEDLKDSLNHIYWLNPEPIEDWDTGDSIMALYQDIIPCFTINSLNSFFNFLKDIIS